jgi:hypothetical protein
MQVHQENSRLTRYPHRGGAPTAGNASVPVGNVHVPLVGVIIGDGWVDPVNMVPAYPDLFYNTGLADFKQAQVVQSYITNVTNAIHAGDYLGAFTAWDEMIK